MDSQFSSSSDVQYQHQQQQGQPWSSSSNLLQPVHPQSSFPSPSTPSSSLDQYPVYHNSYHHHPARSNTTQLSLNISGLTVASPTNLSPITPSPHASTTSAVSPITPISPAHQPLNSGSQSHLHQHHPAVHPFQFVPPPIDNRYDDPMQYDYPRRALTSSRSSSSDEKSIPRKRSFTAGNAMVEENPYETSDMDAHTPGGSVYDDMEVSYNNPISGSPIDGGSNSDDCPMDSQLSQAGVMGKPITTNNFVTKLYQMISDPKSTQFISWTEMGTSFVVSNVAEFSRTILGSHFKHNNFSSFVRQLNMYGFHKINRTPRSQRSSSDVQTWEFSHHKFLRNRPDLLEEIKRKTLDPDPTLNNMKQRLELPGEIVVQLSTMKDENKRMRRELEWERKKVSRLVSVVKTMWDVFEKAVPSGMPIPFPTDLLEMNSGHPNPNILVTGPNSSISTSASPGPPSSSSSASNPQSALPSLAPPSLANHTFSLSPGSSPTAGEFSPTQHSLSRQSSFQHTHGHGGYGYDSALSTPLPPSPGPNQNQNHMDDRAKRQRISPVEPPNIGPVPGSRRVPRARSDSAPMGVGAVPGAGGGFLNGGAPGGYSYPVAGGGRARGLSTAGGVPVRGKAATTPGM